MDKEIQAGKVKEFMVFTINLKRERALTWVAELEQTEVIFSELFGRV